MPRTQPRKPCFLHRVGISIGGEHIKCLKLGPSEIEGVIQLQAPQLWIFISKRAPHLQGAGPESQSSAFCSGTYFRKCRFKASHGIGELHM